MKFYQQLFMLVIIFTTLSLQSCNDSSTSSEEQYYNRKVNRIIEGKYMYLDKNKVWHIDQGCITFILGGESESSKYKTGYGVLRVPRLKSGWSSFAEGNMLCVHCFTDEVLEALEEGDKQKEENNSEETDDENPWY